ncbi:MAG TPA: DUF4326 domain-containing protein [Bryobacteraceae bacterium]|nr:DUF4326 domain-containing protein [Bryobacteraceae bacterium]
MPVRIQRKRTKGWRMPAGAVSVTRPGRFGNPFPVADYGLELSLALFKSTATGIWDPDLVVGMSNGLFAHTCIRASGWRKRLGGHPVEIIRAELRGKDLACFCALDQPCHVDVLLEIANEKEPNA